MLAGHDLVHDAADGAGDDRPSLPHRLGDREPEALGKALLRDDAGVALDGVDDGRVLRGSCIGRHARWMRLRSACGSRRQTSMHCSKVAAPSGSSATPVTTGPARRRCGGTGDVLRESGHDAGHVLQGIPPRHLDDERHVRRRRRARLEHVDMTVDATDGAVLERECSDRRRGLTGEQADVVQHAPRRRPGSWLVLGRERVDRGRDHEGAARIGPVGHVRRSAEHVRVDVVEVRAQELPAPVPCPRSRRRRRHGSATPRSRPARAESCREPGGLRIVQQDDVARSDQRQQLVGVGAQDLLVVAPFVVAERAAVAGRRRGGCCGCAS